MAQDLLSVSRTILRLCSLGIGLQWVGEMQVMNFLETNQDGRPK